MNDKEIIDLYIEKLAFEQTILQLSKCDGRMAVNINQMCLDMESKIRDIERKLSLCPNANAAIGKYKLALAMYNSKMQPA